MELILSKFSASEYKSQAQKIRVMTEGWVNKSVFCPNCGSSLNPFENNSPVACQRQLEMDMATIRNAHGMGACGVRRGLAPAALHTPKKIIWGVLVGCVGRLVGRGGWGSPFQTPR